MELRTTLNRLSHLSPTAGGLLFTRDSVNLQYTTTATLLLFIYSKALSSSGSSGVQCSAANFSPDQISSFAASQVRNNDPSHMFPDVLLLLDCTVRYPARFRISGGLHPGRQYNEHVLHGRLQLQVPKAHSPPWLVDPVDQGSPEEGHLMETTSLVTTEEIPRTLSQQHTSTQHSWVPVLLLWGRTSWRGLQTT